MSYPLERVDLKNCIDLRRQQRDRYLISDFNKAPDCPRNPVRVKFGDGIMFLAACSNGDIDEIVRLINSGANVDTANVDGITALHQVRILDY